MILSLAITCKGMVKDSEKWSMPMYVDGIFGECDLYLNFDGNEADPWDAKVKDVFDIPIDWGILPHFGFFEADSHLFQLEQGDWMVMVHVLKVLQYFPFKRYAIKQERQKCSSWLCLLYP